MTMLMASKKLCMVVADMEELEGAAAAAAVGKAAVGTVAADAEEAEVAAEAAAAGEATAEEETMVAARASVGAAAIPDMATAEAAEKEAAAFKME